MAAAKPIIPEQTAAEATVQPIPVESVPATIAATNLSGAEFIPLYMSMDDGVTWKDYEVDGFAVTLTATNKAIAVYSPILLGATKAVTTGEVGVFQVNPF